ncbi:MAG: hypothetical protein ACYC48_01325 [Minisyncoccota bacterium]
MSTPFRIVIGLVVVLLVVIGAYAAWYTHHRQAITAEITQCHATLEHPAPPTMVRGPGGTLMPVTLVQPCLLQAVPPTLFEILQGDLRYTSIPLHTELKPYTLWDVLTGKNVIGPPSLPACDQSATTTDCASLPSTQSPSQPQGPGPMTATTTTEVIGNFTFAYPKGQGFLSAFGAEGVVYPGDYTLVLNGITNYTLFFFTIPAPLSSINPAARSLDDYRTDYPVSTSSPQQVSGPNGTTITLPQTEVHILSSEEVTINGIPMLRQRYSVGYWTTDQSGQRVFKSDSEASVTNELRYVFFDSTTFVVLTGYQADDWIDYVAHTITLDSILACYPKSPTGAKDTPIPNNSVQQVKETSHMFVNMPKDLYPQDLQHSWSTVAGNATAGSVGGGYGESVAVAATPECWSSYMDFEGSGEVDLRVKSVVKGVPDYFVRFIVSPV